jgi:hypothetical protein
MIPWAAPQSAPASTPRPVPWVQSTEQQQQLNYRLQCALRAGATALVQQCHASQKYPALTHSQATTQPVPQPGCGSFSPLARPNSTQHSHQQLVQNHDQGCSSLIQKRPVMQSSPTKPRRGQQAKGALELRQNEPIYRQGHWWCEPPNEPGSARQRSSGSAHETWHLHASLPCVSLKCVPCLLSASHSAVKDTVTFLSSLYHCCVHVCTSTCLQRCMLANACGQRSQAEEPQNCTVKEDCTHQMRTSFECTCHPGRNS